MNSLINLSGNYVTFDIENKTDLKIKVVGTHKQPYFCGKDVCEILGYTDIKQALLLNVKSKHKKNLKTLSKELAVSDTANFFGSEHLKNITYHSGKAVYVNEPGLYSLIMKSKAPFAEAFQDLVYEIILPSIRQHGQYKVDQELSDALKKLQIEKQEKEKAEKDRNELKMQLRSETDKFKEQIRKTLEFNQATKKIEANEYIQSSRSTLHTVKR
jgi:prophage antirepressor-like protein